MKTFSSDEILNRLKVALEVATDTELAGLLNIKKATISNWRSRNSIDFPLVFSFCEHINLDWLITGRGNKSLSPTQERADIEQIVQPEQNQTLFNKVLEQAEEIGRLKEKVAQLESATKASPRLHTTTQPPQTQTTGRSYVSTQEHV